ncbi:MAG: hypothetical protein ACPGUU_09305, partial [Flavobacteriaceae bacterium]
TNKRQSQTKESPIRFFFYENSKEKNSTFLYALEQIFVFLFSANEFKTQSERLIVEVEKIKNKFPLKPMLIIANKVDQLSEEEKEEVLQSLNTIQHIEALMISAKNNEGVEDLKDKLIGFVNTGALNNNETIVTNTRHYDALLKAFEEIQKVKYGLETGLSGDLMAIDIRQALYHFGEITGEITSDDLLGNIFANFCIGK